MVNKKQQFSVSRKPGGNERVETRPSSKSSRTESYDATRGKPIGSDQKNVRLYVLKDGVLIPLGRSSSVPGAHPRPSERVFAPEEDFLGRRAQSSRQNPRPSERVFAPEEDFPIPTRKQSPEPIIKEADPRIPRASTSGEGRSGDRQRSQRASNIPEDRYRTKSGFMSEDGVFQEYGSIPSPEPRTSRTFASENYETKGPRNSEPGASFSNFDSTNFDVADRVKEINSMSSEELLRLDVEDIRELGLPGIRNLNFETFKGLNEEVKDTISRQLEYVQYIYNFKNSRK